VKRVLCLLMLVASAACSSTAENVVTVREDEPTVFVGNPGLLADLSMTNVATRRRSDGRLEFRADLINRTDDDLRFQWRVEWFDSQGFLVDDPTRTWQPQVLNGRASFQVSQVALMRDAVKAKVHVERPNEIKG